MTVNVAELRAVLEFVTTHPERWDQSLYHSSGGGPTAPPAGDVARVAPDVWSCGTTACVAGWTVLRAGYVPVPGSGVQVVPPGGAGAPRECHDVARDLLRLSDDQADLLFGAGNSLRDVWEFARVFSAGRVVVPAAVRALPPYYFDPGDEDHYAEL